MTRTPPSPLALTAENTLLKAEMKIIRDQNEDLQRSLEMIRELCDTWRMTLPRAAESHRIDITKIVTDALGET